jgi:hypothetical protein
MPRRLVRSATRPGASRFYRGRGLSCPRSPSSALDARMPCGWMDCGTQSTWTRSSPFSERSPASLLSRAPTQGAQDRIGPDTRASPRVTLAGSPALLTQGGGGHAKALVVAHSGASFSRIWPRRQERLVVAGADAIPAAASEELGRQAPLSNPPSYRLLVDAERLHDLPNRIPPLGWLRALSRWLHGSQSFLAGNGLPSHSTASLCP